MHPDDKPWWKRATGYQIYPRSFNDSNGDGIGDLPGIIEKLDHLQALGIGFVWLSPVYASPMADNGYDIADYDAIAPEFGTMDDMQRLVDEAKVRGIRIVMDLVVNHTSSEHAWFQAACASRDAHEHEYYYWRDAAPDGGPPSDRRAVFGGSAWHWVEAVGRYYFAYFSSGQPDLNWQNRQVRRNVFAMMNRWLDRGIGGFRMDVIDLIGKDLDNGVLEQGPDLHPYLQEMHREALAGRDILTVGESWSVTPDTALQYCGRERYELDMVFNFNHVVAGWDPEFGRFKPKPLDLPLFKRILGEWQTALAEDGWNSLFLSNHDLPRAVSRYGDPDRHRVASAKMLATVIHLMKGTPYIYQGEEIGMTNANFTRLEQFRDVETFGQLEDQRAAGVSEADFIAGANRTGRDNARTPMQWSDEPSAGFTRGTPWIDVNDNAVHLNVEADRADPDGVFGHYRRLIALRRQLPIITEGGYRSFDDANPCVFGYVRTLGDQRLVVVGNFTGERASIGVPAEGWGEGRCVIRNGPERTTIDSPLSLAPYESFAVLITGVDG